MFVDAFFKGIYEEYLVTVNKNLVPYSNLYHFIMFLDAFSRYFQGVS